MQAERMLVGTDIELMPKSVLHGMSDVTWWNKWLAKLALLPPKGERQQLGRGFWMHRDGLSVEYGMEPVTSVDEFMEGIHYGKYVVETCVLTSLEAVDWFSIDAIKHDPSLNQYLELGCSPDMVVLGGGEDYQVRRIPEAVTVEGTRECGGHIHVSLPPPFLASKELQAQFIHALDDVVYPMAVMNLGDYRSWYRHRKLFRFTEYGVEYRSLGAAALFGSTAEDVMTAVYDMARSAWEV